jgi:drug/metabolite transporter (DMT)-like permease
MFTDVLGKYHVITLMKWLFLFSAIVLTPITASYIISTPWSLFTMTNWLQLAYIILLATGVAYFLLVVGQKSVSPSAIAIYNYIQPITATISSIIIGVAAITGQNILATMLCLIGVCIVTRKEKEKTQI